MLVTDYTTYSKDLADTLRTRKVRVAASMLDRGTITAPMSHLEHTGFNNTYQESGYSGMGLYYLCRALDINGTGRVSFSLKLAADVLRVSTATIRKWLREGSSLGVDFNTGLPSTTNRFFTHIEYHRGYRDKESWVDVMYRSHHKIALERGMSHLGTVAWVNLSELSDIKGLAVLTTLIELQKASLHQAKKNEIQNLLKQGMDKRLATQTARKPIELSLPDTRDESSKNVLGANILHIGKRCLFADSSNSLAYGASQATIGSKLNRSARSVWNRLNKRYIHRALDSVVSPKKSHQIAIKHKSKHNLPDIYHKQLALTVDLDSSEYAEVVATDNLIKQGLDFIGESSINLNRYFISQGKNTDSANLFKSGCNLYIEPTSIDTCSAKSFKARFTSLANVPT